MPHSLTELYADPRFQAKTKPLINSKLVELNFAPTELGDIMIIRDNVARVEGSTSITATFSTSGYEGEMAITIQQVWQDYSVADLVEQSEIEILELTKL